MCNRDYAREAANCPDEYSTKRSKPTSHAQTKIKLRRLFKRI